MDKFVIKTEKSGMKKNNENGQGATVTETNKNTREPIQNPKFGKPHTKKKREISEVTSDTDDGNESKKPCNLRTTVDSDAQKPSTSSPEESFTVQLYEESMLKWQKLTGENLDCTHCMVLGRREADALLAWCERSVVYNTGDLSQVRVMGKWHNIPRKQVALGDPGLSYKFSGKVLPAHAWLHPIRQIRDYLRQVTGYNFNFVLVNRYKDGDDHIGEHQDDEKELVAGAPIASLTLGQSRDFVFRHKDTRGRNATRKVDPVKIELKHGMLLLMNHPTNSVWYHSLPKRKACPGVRVNMTFRVFKT